MQLQGDEQLLRTIYDPVVRLNSWWFGMNDDDADGIVQYSHPFSSGLDDSPLWDVGMPVEAVDINTYLCIQMEGLERIAHILGRARDAEVWRKKRHALVRRMIEHLYDPKEGLFWNQYDNKPVPFLTPFSLYPLWTGLLPPEINQRLVHHLTNPRTFWTNYPLPTVAPRDPNYDGNQMWRGPVWININHIFIEALLRNGFTKGSPRADRKERWRWSKANPISLSITILIPARLRPRPHRSLDGVPRVISTWRSASARNEI